jgi:D,D-heptose 1,7-bisphosphate phosphatase
MKQKAVFLDKDGTLIPDIPYNADPARITLSPGAGEGLRMLKDHGYRLFVISNQAGVAHGYFTFDALEGIAEKIQQILQEHDVSIDAFFFCPHHPQGSVTPYNCRCSCRKPQPGLILQAALEYDIALENSWMIGDILHDVEAGNKAGCRTILLDNGNETQWIPGPYRLPTRTACTIPDAVSLILNHVYAC